jgi:hypothetical protein
MFCPKLPDLIRHNVTEGFKNTADEEIRESVLCDKAAAAPFCGSGFSSEFTQALISFGECGSFGGANGTAAISPFLPRNQPQIASRR